LREGYHRVHVQIVVNLVDFGATESCNDGMAAEY